MFLMNLHTNFNFTNLKNMTKNVSLLDSCRIVFIEQGISLHYDSQDKTAISLALIKNKKLVDLSLL